MAAAAAVDVRIKVFAGGVICFPQKWAAKFLGVTPQRFRQLEIEPHAHVGRAPWYAVADLAERKLEREGPPSSAARVNEDATERLKQIKVEEAELDLAERRGELVQAASVQAAFDAVLLESNARFGGIAHSIADEVMSAADRETVVRIIEAAVNGARELFANLRVPIAGADRLGAERGARPAAAANGNGGGMGGPEPRSVS